MHIRIDDKGGLGYCQFAEGDMEAIWESWLLAPLAHVYIELLQVHSHHQNFLPRVVK